jgi:hypothetical protein
MVNAYGSPTWQALGVQPCQTEILWACAGLRGMAWRSGDHACLWIPSLAGLRSAGLAEIMNTRGSQAQQALGAQLGKAEIVWACTGPRGAVQRRSCGSEWGSLVDRGPSRAEEWAKGSEIPWPVEQRLRGAYGAGLGMQHQPLFQQVMVWRSLPQAMGSEC